MRVVCVVGSLYVCCVGVVGSLCECCVGVVWVEGDTLCANTCCYIVSGIFTLIWTLG